ncbi:MAG: helix-turn-helix domain-containing protein [Actinobacteria bacterium]|nr:helix-turn-helix domain-containing protein [Actinomycetota bacterium]
MTELLTPKEVARRYGAPRDFVYSSLQTGRLKGIRRGTRWLVATFAVEEWLRLETADSDGHGEP